MSQLKERDTYFDNVKGFLMILVVVAHFADQFTSESIVAKTTFLWAYCFHMPLFLFVGGYFSGSIVQSGTRVKRRAVEFLSLYLFYKIAIYVVDYCIDREASFNLLSEYEAPWYMAALAVYYTLLYFLKDVKPDGFKGLIKNPVLVTSVILALMVGYDSEINDFLMLSRIIVFFPFFYAGYLLRNVKLKEKIKKICPTAVGMILLAASFAAFFLLLDRVYVLRPMFTGRNPYSTLKDMADYGALYRLAAYTITSVICVLFLAAVPKRKVIGVSAVGRATMQVYLYHQLIRNAMYDCGVFDQLLQYGTPGKAALLLIPVVLTFILAIPALGWPVKAWHNAIEKYVN